MRYFIVHTNKNKKKKIRNQIKAKNYWNQTLGSEGKSNATRKRIYATRMDQ